MAKCAFGPFGPCPLALWHHAEDLATRAEKAAEDGRTPGRWRARFVTFQIAAPRAAYYNCGAWRTISGS